MKSILVIDDEPSLRRLMRKSLEAQGYAVREAENGRDGIAQCAVQPPDLIITDIFMPEQDGLETLRTLRKSQPDIRVIAMSGGGYMGDLDVLRTARLMGARTILSKPFDMQTLAQAVQDELDAP